MDEALATAHAPLGCQVTAYCLGAEHAADAAGSFAQVHEYDSVASAMPAAVPTAQRFEVGADGLATPCAVPQDASSAVHCA